MASKEAKTKCCGKTNDEMSLPKSEPAKKKGCKRQLKNNNENQLKCVNTRSKSKAKMRLNESPMPEPVRKKTAHKTLNKKYIVEAWLAAIFRGCKSSSISAILPSGSDS